MMNKKDVIILGAGPAGMAAALELGNAGKDFTVIEKEGGIGGLSRTLRAGRFRTDIGPHRFFSRSTHLYDLIEDLLGESWTRVDRRTRFFIDGQLFRYPVEIMNVIPKVGTRRAMKIALDYITEKCRSRLSRRCPESFEEIVVSEFGRKLAELNVINYTEKIWGIPCREISGDWAMQRIRGLSVKEMAKRALRKSPGVPKTMVEQFYYPDEGTGMIYDAMRRRISQAEGTVKTRSRPLKIRHDGKMITGLLLDLDGKRAECVPGEVISSIPVTEFVRLLEPRAPRKVMESLGKLRFRSHVSLFIKLDRESVFSDQWIYFPEREIPFGRVSEPRNFSRKMSPEGKTSLLVEFFCWEDDDIWKAGDDELLSASLPWLGRICSVKRSEIIGTLVHRESHAYPVYDLGYKNHLGVVMGYLDRFSNLQLIGRGGRFRYNNQDQAMEMGILSARNVVVGERKHDVTKAGKGRVNTWNPITSNESP